MLTLAALVLTTCGKETPSEPARDNPLDAQNPTTAGDPLALRMGGGTEQPVLRWSAAGAPGVSGYRVYRSVDGGEYTRLTDVAASVTEYPDRSVADGHQYRYYVVARGAGGESSADAVVRTLWRAPPVATVAEAISGYTTEHMVTLQLQAYGAARMQLSSEASLADAASQACPPGLGTRDSGLGTRS